MVKYLVLIVFTSFSFNIIAQPRPQVKKPPPPKQQGFIDLSLTMGVPMESFAETTTSLPFGFTFNYLYQPYTRNPIAFGGGITYLSAGSRSIDKNLTADITVGNTLIDQLVIPLEFTIRNQIVNGHVMMRVQGHNKYFKPYLDILGGFNYFWTSTALYDRSPESYFDTDDNNRIFQKRQASDITWSAGGGVGFMARLGSSVYLNLGANYMFGGKVNYYDRDQIEEWNIELNASAAFNPNQSEQPLNEDDVNVDAFPKSSRTHMIFANLGVTFLL
ncbi:MAG: hypothetical protein WED33_02160 [Bacteroidia bacterium]